MAARAFPFFPVTGAALRTVGIFLLTFCLSMGFVIVDIKNKADIERMTMERLIIEKSIKIAEVISRLLHKTQALAALVVQDDGQAVNFERSAAVLMDDPSILNLLVAPQGVVSHVYPLQGNEGVLRYNLLGTGAGNKEAQEAVAKTAGFRRPFSLGAGRRPGPGGTAAGMDCRAQRRQTLLGHRFGYAQIPGGPCRSWP